MIEPNGRRRSIQITGTAPTGLGSSCSRNLGLKTDVPANTFQYGAVLAANRPGVVQPVVKLMSPGADWRTVSTLLPGIYKRHEATIRKGMPQDFLPEMAAPLSNPRLDAAFIFRDELGEYVYFESSREFAQRPEQRGESHPFITGWLWRASSAMPFQLVSVRAVTRDGDGKGENSFHPLGVVAHGSRRFWLGELSSYAYSGLAVLDVRRAGITERLAVDSAGC